MTSLPLRFGLVGTGHWARTVHAPALASTEGVQFSAVWGRNQRAAADLAAGYQVTPHEDLAEFLAAVDGVAFAVPPDVQAPIAAAAARAGKHLLLEKPLALTQQDADDVDAAVEQAGVASVVFFTQRFRAQTRAWLDEIAARGGWTGGTVLWLGSALSGSSPFNSPWRRAKGALWDVAPHAVALLWASLGPVTSVTADAGPADAIHLILHHGGAATSTVTASLSVSEAAAGLDLSLWGAAGRSVAPVGASEPVEQLRTALRELAGLARAGRAGHPCDARFGRDVVRVLADAERQAGVPGSRGS